PNTVLRIGGARTLSIGFYGANFGAINNQWPNATRQRLVQPDPFEPAIILGAAPPKFVSGFDILAEAGNPGRYPTPRTSTSFGTDPDNPTHSVYQWNVAIQHQFAQNVTATIAYVGNASRHLFYRRDYNAAVPGPGPFLSRRAYGFLGYLTPAYNQRNQTSSGYQGVPFRPVVANGGAIPHSRCCTPRPNRDANGAAANPTRHQSFDASAYTVPSQYQFGNAGRNILRGPSFSSADWALAKKFALSEQ